MGEELFKYYCPECKAEVKEDHRYCPNCGKPLKVEERRKLEEKVILEKAKRKQEIADRIRRVVFSYGVAGLLIVVGSALPWLKMMGFTVSGVDVSGLKWGIWTLFLGIGSLWIVAYSFANEKKYFSTIFCAIGIACLCITLGILGYYFNFIHFSCFHYGLYFVIAGSIIFVFWGGKHMQLWKMRTWLGGITSLVLILTLSILIGYSRSKELKGVKISPDFMTTTKEIFTPEKDFTDFMKRTEEIGKALKHLQVPTPQTLVPPSLGVSPPVVELKPKGEYEVNRYFYLDSIGSGYSISRPEAGKRFIVVNISFTNTDSKEVYVSDDDFKLVASDKNVYYPRTLLLGYDEKIQTLHARLLPGGYTTGDVVFEVPINVEPERILYEPGPF